VPKWVSRRTTTAVEDNGDMEVVVRTECKDKARGCLAPVRRDGAIAGRIGTVKKV